MTKIKPGTFRVVRGKLCTRCSGHGVTPRAQFGRTKRCARCKGTGLEPKG